MKSQLLRLADYRTIDFPMEPCVFTIDDLEHEIQNDIDRDLLSHRVFKAVDTIKGGDSVIISTKCAIKKYNRPNLPVCIGLNLFSEELESSLIGHKSGDSFSLLIQGEPVEVKILSAQRNVPATLCDDFVKLLNLPNVTNVREYHDYLEKYYRDFYQKGFSEWYAAELFDKVCKFSQWQIDENEYHRLLTRFHQFEEEIRTAHDETLGDEENAKEMLAIEEENFRQFFYMVLVDCYQNHRDSEDAEMEFSLNYFSELRDRTLAPLEEYLSPKVEIRFEKGETE